MELSFSVEHLLKFCQFYPITPFPASASTVAAFIILLSFSVKSHHTINNYLSALRRLHVFCHFDTSGFDDIDVKLTQKGLEKSMVHLYHRKAALTPDILLQFYRNLDLRDSAHLALWYAVLVGFFSFFRTANLVPRSLNSFSPHQVLYRSSITFTSSGTLITVTHRKTRQAGDTALVVPVPFITGSPLCPTTALHLYLWPFQPLIVHRSLPFHTFGSVRLYYSHDPQQWYVDIWPPRCLLIPIISLVIVSVV